MDRVFSPSSLLALGPRWAILGNSGSGKSTLARQLGAATGARVVDLDPYAWRRDRAEPELRPAAEVLAELEPLLGDGPWVVEGCYEHLVEALAPRGVALVLLDVPAEVCAARVRARAFEPHKYPTPEAQREATEFLAAWILESARRDGPLSRRAHEALFARWPGPKMRVG